MLLMIYSLRLLFQYFLYFLGYYLIYLNNFSEEEYKNWYSKFIDKYEEY